MPLTIFGLGSNLGDKENTLQLTFLKLSAIFGSVIFKAGIYQSKPLVKPNSPAYFQNLIYLNSAIAFETKIDPLSILKEIKKIEAQLGREVRSRWEPRVIDIDILFIEGIEFESQELKVPHAELLNRDFALIPLIEILNSLNISSAKYQVALDKLKNKNSLFTIGKL